MISKRSSRFRMESSSKSLRPSRRPKLTNLFILWLPLGLFMSIMACDKVIPKISCMVSAFSYRYVQGRNFRCRRNGLNLDYPMRSASSSFTGSRGSPLFSNDNDDRSNDVGSSRSDKKRLFSARRIGGRSRKKPIDLPSSSKDKSKNWLSGRFLITALLALTLLKNLFFSGGGSDTGYYYYSYSSSSSSVYETVTNPDGSQRVTETSRKQSSDLKSNIPGLTNENFFLENSVRDNRPNALIDIYDDYGF